MTDHGTTCPVCGAAAQRGQLVCLECGSRVTLGYRRPPSWKVPVAITAAVLILAAAGAALAYRAADGEAEREAAAAPANPKPNTDPPVTDAQTETAPEEPATDDEPRPTDTDAEKPEEDAGAGDGEIELGNDDPSGGDDLLPGDSSGGGAATGSGALGKRGDLFTWPRDLRAFTVVLLSAEDQLSAASFARSAAGSGNDKIGVIRSRDFETLPRGFFVVFAGKYPDRRRADRAAARLGGRFPGAFAQLVRK